MPNPTAGDLHVNAPLTNISVAYIQKATNFIADRVFPTVPVLKQSDRYFVYNKGDWHRNQAQKRAPGTPSAGGGWKVDNTPTYFADIYAFHKDIDDPTRANADAPIRMDADSTEFVTQMMLLRRETLWASRYFVTNVWGNEFAGVAANPNAQQFLQWSVANSTPIKDVTDKAIVVAESTGYKPNKLVISPYVLNVLKNHPDILDRIKYTQRGQVTTDILAGLFEVDEVLVPFAIQNTAAEGAADTMSFIYGKHALLVYAAPSPSLMAPSGGYTFAWTGLYGAGAYGNRIKRFRMEELESDRVEGEMAFDQKLVAADVGVFLKDAIA
jgi:hypothetical protein